MNFDKKRIRRKTVEKIKETMQVVKEEYGTDCACESGEIIKVILRVNYPQTKDLWALDVE